MVELLAGVLLLSQKYRAYGAVLGLGVISGALFFHLTSLGIEVLGDDGRLFYYALTVFISCLLLLIMRKKDIPLIGQRF